MSFKAKDINVENVRCGLMSITHMSFHGFSNKTKFSMYASPMYIYLFELLLATLSQSNSLNYFSYIIRGITKYILQYDQMDSLSAKILELNMEDAKFKKVN